MEEVDKIIIHSLKDVGCDIDDEIKSLQQFTTELVVEAAVKCLDVIVTPKLGLPTSLPQSMSARFRLGTTIAEACLELGYNGEMGYQTFLYPSEAELRKIFVFLIEKLPKDSDKGTSQDDDGVLTLRQQIGECLKASLARPWVRSRGAVEYIPFLAEPLETGISLPGQKRDCTPQAWRDYCVNELPFVHEQLKVRQLLAPSLLVENACGLVGGGGANSLVSTPTGPSGVAACWGGREATNHRPQNMSWLAVREKLVHRSENLRAKSEPPKSEQMQKSMDSHVEAEADAKSEEQRMEEERVAIEQLREKIDELKTLSKTLNAKLVNIGKETEKEVEIAKARKRDSEMRQKTVDLLPDSDANIAKLEAMLQASVQRMITLAEKWEKHRAPLIESYREARKRIASRNTESVRQQETTREMREKLRELADQLRNKETFQTRLQEDIEKLPKDIVTRPAYTRRIMEIIGNIRKQKEDIDKIVKDTKQLQKDINNESGKLERSFTVADDLIFRDAKRDESSKKAYIMLAKLHSEFGELVAMVEENGAIVREIRDLEEQVSDIIIEY
ncbi:coiled-coil domain-containing protein 22 homolog [Nilaparvata lugens]|uniref:coiled-coil domain-containing protein 22 homolog n=1 Tax=Nilaparvata lugens TaxID=108931 RepID=UPI00193E486D|nr:coiled-coil domain-containing protein 22 homolog [Nilaparvata lugens]